jgi:hypothetical protein
MIPFKLRLIRQTKQNLLLFTESTEKEIRKAIYNTVLTVYHYVTQCNEKEIIPFKLRLIRKQTEFTAFY